MSSEVQYLKDGHVATITLNRPEKLNAVHLPYDEVLEHPQSKHNGTCVTYEYATEGTVTTPGFPIRFSRTPSTIRLGAPVVGEHTTVVLEEIGYPREQVEQLLAKNIVTAPGE